MAAAPSRVPSSRSSPSTTRTEATIRFLSCKIKKRHLLTIRRIRTRLLKKRSSNKMTSSTMTPQELSCQKIVRSLSTSTSSYSKLRMRERSWRRLRKKMMMLLLGQMSKISGSINLLKIPIIKMSTRFPKSRLAGTVGPLNQCPTRCRSRRMMRTISRTSPLSRSLSITSMSTARSRLRLKSFHRWSMESLST